MKISSLSRIGLLLSTIFFVVALVLPLNTSSAAAQEAAPDRQRRVVRGH